MSHLLPEQVPNYLEIVIGSVTDRIKVLAENPGLPTLSQATLNALAKAACSWLRKFAVCHSTACESATIALDAGVDQIHQIPLDKRHDRTTTQKSVAKGVSSCPTLAMIQAVVDRNSTENYSFAVASKSVRALY